MKLKTIEEIVLRELSGPQAAFIWRPGEQAWRWGKPILLVEGCCALILALRESDLLPLVGIRHDEKWTWLHAPYGRLWVGKMDEQKIQLGRLATVVLMDPSWYCKLAKASIQHCLYVAYSPQRSR